MKPQSRLGYGSRISDQESSAGHHIEYLPLFYEDLELESSRDSHMTQRNYLFLDSI